MSTETWIVSGPQIIDLDSVRSVQGSIIRGTLNIVAHDEPTTRIEVRSVNGRPLEITLSDTGELTVSYPFLSWDFFVEKLKSITARDSADVTIAIPRNLPVKLGTVAAEGFLTGIQGNCEVNTVSGDIVIDDISGELSTNSASGDVEIRGHHGTVRAHTVSGNITASGIIPTFSVDTVSGDILADLERGSSVVKVNTVSGEVTVRRPGNIGVKAQVSLVTGRLIVDGQNIGGSRPGRTYVDRVFGDGQVYLDATGVSSNITVITGPTPTSTQTSETADAQASQPSQASPTAESTPTTEAFKTGEDA